jgi:hypothetical protein
MGIAKVKEKKIEIPLSVFDTAQTKEELEDWLLAHDPDFIKRMRKAQKEFAEGKGKDWETIKKELCIK